MEAESRKRPHADDEEHGQSKKRVLADANGSPHVNGRDIESTDEPSEADNLELFRKEAIFRKMKYYSRENDRNRVKVAELERRKNTYETSLAAMSACWTQLNSAIRLLTKPDALPKVEQNTKDILDLTAHLSGDASSELATALQHNMGVTQELVTKLTEVHGRELFSSEGCRECQKSATECTTLRAELKLVQSKLKQTCAENDMLEDQLRAAEERASRLQSKTAMAMDASMTRTDVVKKADDVEEAEEPVGQKPATPPSPQPPTSPPLEENAGKKLESLYGPLWAEARGLRVTVVQQETELMTLKSHAEHPAESVIINSPSYRVLMQHCSMLEASNEEDKAEMKKLQAVIDEHVAWRKEHEDALSPLRDQTIQELKALTQKKDVDLGRLRSQRDQQAAEILERKQKDATKMASLKELKMLVDSRDERISTLELEIKRCRARIAANVGDKDLMVFFSGDAAVDTPYVDDLRTRLSAAEAKTSSMEQTLSTLNPENPDVASHLAAEVDARQQLEQVTKQLDKYKYLYGEGAMSSDDSPDLSAPLEAKEAETQQLRLQNQQLMEAESSIYNELGRLSAAWEVLDKQVKDKVFDLTAMEERVTKTSLDKTKTENKFYAVMRDKEAIELEKKAMGRHAEKQAKVVERLLAVEKNLKEQVNAASAELEKMRVLSRACQDREDAAVLRATRSAAQHQSVLELLEKVKADFAQQRAEVAKLKHEVRDKQEAVTRHKVDLEVKTKELAKEKGKQRDVNKAGREDDELKKAYKLLKCSTCEHAFRSIILKSCSHSFCKECIDKRLSTRQRKCPACALPFSATDVQSFYFQ